MKTPYLISLLAFIFASCNQQVYEPSGMREMAPAIEPGACAIGKWSESSLPLKLTFSSEFLLDFDSTDSADGLNPIEQMAKVWNDAVAVDSLFQLPFEVSNRTQSKTLDGFRDSHLGIYKSHEWFNDIDSSALAITQFFGTVESSAQLGTYISLTHADIIFNYRDFGSQFSYEGNASGFDVPTILLHEMGHFLGLCHENKYDSVMAPYYSSAQRNLKTFDTAKIRALYLENKNYGVKKIEIGKSAISSPVGSEVSGVIELNSSGICRHYLGGELVYQHLAR